MTSKLNGTRPTTASVQAVTVTTHVIHVDLAAQLSGIDFMDSVVLMINTPSGRDKRVALGGGFLVEPHHDAGYGTCDHCGTVNIAVSADRLCRNCR
jgi:hypothetical protein